MAETEMYQRSLSDSDEEKKVKIESLVLDI